MHPLKAVYIHRCRFIHYTMAEMAIHRDRSLDPASCCVVRGANVRASPTRILKSNVMSMMTASSVVGRESIIIFESYRKAKREMARGNL